MNLFAWFKRRADPLVAASPRSASVKCCGCDGWSHEYTAEEVRKSAYIQTEDHTSLWFCGRCDTVSEWHTSAPVLLFLRSLLHVKGYTEILNDTNDLLALHNSLIFNNVLALIAYDPIWTSFDQLRCRELMQKHAELGKTVEQMKLTIKEYTNGNAKSAASY